MVSYIVGAYNKLVRRWDNYWYTSYSSSFKARRSEFRDDVKLFLAEKDRSLRELNRKERKFLLNVGGAIYSTLEDGFTLETLKSEFYEEFGQYIRHGLKKGYRLPADPEKFMKNSKISELGILVVEHDKGSDSKAIVLSTDFIKVREGNTEFNMELEELAEE